MSFPPQVKERALVACGRCCCICHKSCGLKIECHHIRQVCEGGADDFENCIPLCLDCHADQRSYDKKHPKGTKYTPSELRRHRDCWYERRLATPAISPYTASHCEADRRTAEHLCSFSIPVDELLDFEFGCMMNGHMLDPIWTLEREISRALVEFLDTDLEQSRAELSQALGDFCGSLGELSGPCTRHGWYRVSQKDHSDEARAQFFQDAQTLGAAARVMCAAYIAFRRLVRRKLGVG